MNTCVERKGTIMKSHHPSRTLSWFLVFAFILLVAGTLATGLLFYKAQEKRLKAEAQKSLAAIADLKEGQIIQWRRERISDAELFLTNISFIRQVEQYFKNPTEKTRREELLAFMKSFIQHGKYESTLIIDPQGMVRLAFSPHLDSIGSYGKTLVQQVLQDKKIVFTDFHKSEIIQFPHIDIGIPLFKTESIDSTVVAIAFFRINPEDMFYPMLQTWPNPSRTAEAILIEKDQDDVLFLNRLRHVDNTPLEFRLPISNKLLPSSMAIRSILGTVEGKDYRNISVLAASRAIPETPWFIVAKIDDEEVYAPLRSQTWIVGSGMFLLILASGGIIGFWWRHQRARFYREQYENQLERQALTKHFEYLVTYANDVIFLIDAKGRIREANNRACELYGYTREEFLWLTLFDLRSPATRASAENQFSFVKEHGSILFETEHQRKDGSVFPVEVSARAIEIEGGQFVQSIIRDITERKMVEDILRESTDEIQDLYNNAPCGYHSLNSNGVFVRINDTELRWTGYSREELLNTTKFSEILTPESHKKFETEFSYLKQLGAINDVELSIIRKDGSILSVSLNATAINDAYGNFVMSRSTIFDITDRQLAEKKILQLNRIHTVVTNVNQMIVRTRDRQSILNSTCQITVNDGRFRMACIGLVEENSRKIIPAAKAGFSDGFVEHVCAINSSSKDVQDPTTIALQTGNHVIINNIEHDKIAAQWRQKALELNFQSSATFPLRIFSRVIGVFNLYSSEKDFFDEKEVQLLDELAMDLGYALESVELENQRKQAEEEVHESEERFARLAESAFEAIVISERGNILDFNKQLATMFGYSPNELYGMHFSAFVAPESMELVQEHIKSGSEEPYEHFAKRKDGSIFPVEIRAKSIPFKGRPVRVTAINDISTRKQAEEKITSSLSLLRATLDSTADGILVVDKSGKITNCNNQFAQMWNIPNSLLATNDDQKLLEFVKDQLSRPNEFLQKVIDLYQHPEMDSFDILEFKDGKIFERYSHPQWLEGKPVGRVWSFRDVTEQKRTANALNEEHNLLHTLINTLPDNVFIKDVDGRILIDNIAHREQFGLRSQEEINGKTDFDFFPKELAEGYFRSEQEIVQTGKPLINHEEFATYPDGSHKWKLTTKVPLRDQSNKIIGIVGINRDITQRKKAEKELYNANQMLQLVFDNIPQRIFWKDTNSKFLGCNKSFALDAGFSSPADLIGKDDYSMSWKDTAELYRADDAQVMKSDIAKLNYEEPQSRPNGDLLWLRTNKVPLHDQKGEVIGVLGTYEDITERKQIEQKLRENEEKYRHLFELESDALFLIDDETGKILEANAAAIALYGYTRDELLNMYNYDLSAEPQKTKRAGKSFNSMHIPVRYHRKKDGVVFPVEITAARLTWLGKPAHMPAIRDITERLRGEENIRESEDKFRSLAEQSPNMIFINTKGRIVYVNQRCEEIMGFSKEEFYSNDFNFMSLIDEKDQPILQNNFKKHMQGEDVLPIEYTVITKNKRRINVILSTKLIRYGGTQSILGTITDITVQKSIEDALRQSETLFRTLAESSPVAIAAFDSDTNKTAFVSQRFIELLGYTQEDISSMDTLWPLAYPNKELRKQIESFWQKDNYIKQAINNSAKSMESIITCSDGSHKYVETTLIPIGNLLLLFFADLTQRRLAEEALHQTHEFNELLIEAMPFGIDIVDEEGKILFLSKAMKDMIGFDAVNSCCWDVYRDDHKQCSNCPLKNDISFGKPETIETTQVFGGKTYQISHVGMMYKGKKAVLEVFQDITEQKKLQQELLQSQKLQSIGTIAGGIAHDFNNILGIILGYISIIPSIKENDKRFSDGVNAIKQAVDRGAALVRQILTFARKTDVVFKSVNMPELVHELISMLQQTFPKVITLNANTEKHVPTINADPTQIHQALLNLCVNARDAMPNGGDIIIAIDTVAGETLREKFPLAHETWYESVSVKDTGLGMDETTKSRIFDPFFTTKEKGKGTGLGLSVVYGIIQAHQGFVDVESYPEGGTTISLYFPIPKASTVEFEERPISEESEFSGTETILVVEDEVLLSEMVQILLETHGYKVMTAADGQEAVEIYKKHSNNISLVLSDMGLPKLTGIDEFRKLKEINPKVKLIFASGHIEPEIKKELLQAGAKEFIQKPYVITEVLTKIRRVLESKEA